MSKTVLVTGGTGFIGQVLCRELLARGYDLTVLSRQPDDQVKAICGRVKSASSLKELESGSGFDAVINLAGEGIADKRWSKARKKALRDSRILLTKELVSVVRGWDHLPEVLVSGSAVGFYGDQGTSTVTEETSPHDEFTHQLCQDWELAARDLEKDGVRVCISRTGVVVGANGGFLTRMILPFKLGFGGRLGTGQQFMPWVHRTDVVQALIWMLETPSAKGAFNVVSPQPATNQEFTRQLGKVLHRPTPFPAPGPILRIALGEMSRLLLTGQRAIPERLKDADFNFRYTDLSSALEDAIRG
ncbi:MAG: TIGR01777 family protein [Gammaproteobacteria bacterium]|nr:MAG: TIGR01777 family protein [Gammaproteobacteria bacterium]